jgi:hypothetical protein
MKNTNLYQEFLRVISEFADNFGASNIYADNGRTKRFVDRRGYNELQITPEDPVDSSVGTAVATFDYCSGQEEVEVKRVGEKGLGKRVKGFKSNFLNLWGL